MLYLLVVFVTLLSCNAQSSNVSCVSSFDWMNNVDGYSPCVVAASLLQVCHPAGVTIWSPGSGSKYSGPTADLSNPCQCSRVTYSLLCACAACQSLNWTDWAAWANNCGAELTSDGFSNLPSNISVPQWAYLNASDSFNVTAAQAAAETSGTPSAIPSKRHARPGLVAGAVVGGAVGLAVIIGVSCLILRKRQRQVLRSEQGSRTESSQVSQLQQGIVQHKLYDPSDPNTFPSPHIEDTAHAISVSRPGQYTGAPEISMTM